MRLLKEEEFKSVSGGHGCADGGNGCGNREDGTLGQVLVGLGNSIASGENGGASNTPSPNIAGPQLVDPNQD